MRRAGDWQRSLLLASSLFVGVFAVLVGAEAVGMVFNGGAAAIRLAFVAVVIAAWAEGTKTGFVAAALFAADGGVYAAESASDIAANIFFQLGGLLFIAFIIGHFRDFVRARNDG